jgi:ribosomal protein L1
MKSLADKKPNGLKGKYFIAAYLKSTMGPRWKINMNDIDPRMPKNVWSLFDSEEESQ